MFQSQPIWNNKPGEVSTTDMKCQERRKACRKESITEFRQRAEFNPSEDLHFTFNQPFLQQVRKEDFRGDWTLMLALDRRAGLPSNRICAHTLGVKAKYMISTFLFTMEKPRNWMFCMNAKMIRTREEYGLTAYSYWQKIRQVWFLSQADLL